MTLQVVLIYSANGWRQMEAALSTFNSSDQSEVINLLNNAFIHLVNSNKSHYLQFNSVKIGELGLDILVDHIPTYGSISEAEYHFTILNQVSGDSDQQGGWTPNDFNPRVRHHIVLDKSDGDYQSDCGLTVTGIPATLRSPSSPPVPMVDNYTCTQCGNTKCNTTESSCWRCGTLIVP